MEIQILPNEISTINQGNIQLHEYHLSKSLNKSKVQLSKNVFSFLLEGTKELITHNSSTTIDSNNFLMIKSGNCLMSENISLSKNYRSMLLFFSDDVIADFIKKYEFETKDIQKNEALFICEYDAISKNIVDGLQQIKNQPEPFLNKILLIKFEEIVLYIIQKKGVGFLNHFIAPKNSNSQSFVQTVQKNALKNLTIQELSFLCNMSTSTFKRQFEKEFNSSPIRWFQEKRLEHSAYLLQSKKLRPSDIYFEVGFESLSSFVQAYKQKFGVTPKQSQVAI